MDFTKICWYCGRNDMMSCDDFYVCQNCGASWNEVPKPGVGTIVEEKIAPGVTQYRLSKRLVRGIGKKIKRRKKDAVNI